MKPLMRMCGVMAGVVLFAAGVWIWYESLDYDKKRFVNNVINQSKYLPDRYQV